MAGKKILMMMTGSIAAYKACHMISRLVQAGHQVQVAASPSALQFVGNATLEGLSGRPVVSDLWERERAMDHIHLIREADLILVAPGTAHFINRIAGGIGDDLLTTLFLAHDFKKPFLIAPAMNTTMYLHPVTQASLKKIKDMGLRILETASGVLACGETGFGKLLDPDLILQEVLEALGTEPATTARPVTTASSLSPIKVLITSGGTKEPLDDVRVLTNSSTGRSGAELSNQLSDLGFDVTLLRAKEAVIPTSADVVQKTYVTHSDLKELLQTEIQKGSYSHVIHMAAVSDYQVDKVLLDGQETKASKVPSGRQMTIQMKPAEKILPLLKTWTTQPLKVAAFKLTSHASSEERRQAMSKLFPAADVVISNDLSEISEGKHPYLAKTSAAETPLAGLSELSAWFSNWILNKETL
ncbi:MAG: bifunctional phosphopantothenoylcysteine decarboxylase/phosphopantothenate--cysteine ligase CoaBC [Bdellovibrionaceae bacterium]|nr:bifunctional phosphopantothenoylcysteine decarboxylase/phosphopantothenate--cysteine ligase CoaBC [Pseudobdellovibrionaceae bacterium]